MKEKILHGVMILMAIFIIGMLIRNELWITLGVFCVFAACAYVREKISKTSFKNEMADISEKLEQILYNKDVLYDLKEEDTLYSKITVQIKRIDEINRARQEQLQKERDSTRQLLAEISHQLRTPLTNIETYITLLDKQDTVGEEEKTYIQAIENAEQKINFLVNQYILAARMENRIIQIHKFEQDMKETIAQAIFGVYRKAEKKQINIILNEDNNPERLVNHDRNWICESIFNLLDNSIKYSPENTTIIVTLRNNEMFTEIEIADEGIGISPDEDNKVFQPYYRGTNITNQEGHGLGMFITNQIVKKHNGFMRIKHKEVGLIVSIFLPKMGT